MPWNFEDETVAQNGERNANRNPEWWGDYSQPVKIEKIKISRYLTYRKSEQQKKFLIPRLLSISTVYINRRHFYMSVPSRVQRLPIGDCAASPNNCVPRRPKLSAIEVTAKAICERLYLVPGLSPFEPRVNCPYAPTPPPLTHRLIVNFRAIVFTSGPHTLVSTIRQVIWPSTDTLVPSNAKVPAILRKCFNTNYVYVGRKNQDSNYRVFPIVPFQWKITQKR